MTDVALRDCHVEGERGGPWNIRVTHLPTGVVRRATAKSFEAGRDKAIARITTELRRRGPA